MSRKEAVGLLVIGGYELISGWRSSKHSVPFVTIVFTFDGFAQLSGQLYGKRRILPKISPDKTVAGVVGGYVTGVITGLFVMRWLNMEGHITWLSPFLICTGAFIGDALASWYKRNCDLKDYSKFIPGHGGTLTGMIASFLPEQRFGCFICKEPCWFN